MSTSFPPFIHMISTGRFRLAVCVLLLSTYAWPVGAQTGAAQPVNTPPADTPTTAPPATSDATLYRVFLRDGSTIVSYGEFARVGDRVVVTLPLGGASVSDLQLLTLPADAVDWEKTDAYAESARAARYAQTRGPDEFALLNQSVEITLNDVALVADPQRKIQMAAEARRNVMKWAADHYGYRAQDVARLAGLFDAVIAQTRGAANYDLALVAGVAAAPPPVPPQAMPGVQERVEQAMRAASLAPDAGERISLLQSIQNVLATVDGRPQWATALASRVDVALGQEMRTEHAYGTLIHSSLAQADRYARVANVGGIERLVRRVLREDDQLGQQRPNEMASTLATLDAQLDAARRLRLALDSFEARVSVIRAYQRAVAQPIALMRVSRPSLDAIRRLAGPSPSRVTALATDTAAALKGLAAATVPPEADAVNGLLRNAITLASQAASGRLQAIASGDMKRAWDASSAAAGALMLFDRAAEQVRQLTPPRPRAAS
jgi:hypothetical protein